MIYGKTTAQRDAERKARWAKRESWRRWFAWRPVRLDEGDYDTKGRTVWLEVIERRSKWLGGGWLTYYREARLQHRSRVAPMTWDEACDWIDNLVDIMACIDEERGNYPALTWYDRQMREAEQQLDAA